MNGDYTLLQWKLFLSIFMVQYTIIFPDMVLFTYTTWTHYQKRYSIDLWWEIMWWDTKKATETGDNFHPSWKRSSGYSWSNFEARSYQKVGWQSAHMHTNYKRSGPNTNTNADTLLQLVLSYLMVNSDLHLVFNIHYKLSIKGLIWAQRTGSLASNHFLSI